MNKSGVRLKHIREQKQLSQAELAEKTGISKGTISMAERNITAITIDNLAKICKELQVSADYIVFGEVSERDDEWRQLSATQDGLTIRQVALNLYKNKKLTPFLTEISKLNERQIDIVLQLAKSLQASD
jgi:transcriptional regulator with XRE-family HTH domain